MKQAILIIALAFLMQGCTDIEAWRLTDGTEYIRVRTFFEDPKIDWIQWRTLILQTYEGSTTPIEASSITPIGPVKGKIGG